MARGATPNKRRKKRASLEKNDRPTIFFKMAFLTVLRQGARGFQKHHKTIFAKSPCQKLFPKKSTTISMSVFPRHFFNPSFGCFSAMGVFQKNRVEKFLQKNRPKIQNRCFSRFFLITFLGVSRRGEFKNTREKAHRRCHRKTNSTPVLFWPLTHPPPPRTTGVTEKTVSCRLWPAAP
jgi:hypothetical protein